jgi:DNA-binding NarL/FixJ family response regulator
MSQPFAVSPVGDGAPERVRSEVLLRVVPAPYWAELRKAALLRVRLGLEPCELGPVWSMLCSGLLKIRDSFSEADQTVVVLERRSLAEAAGHALRGRQLEILERTLEGQSLNSISIDLSLSNATVSAEFKKAGRALGFCSRLSALPVFSAQLWRAARAGARIEAGSAAFEFGERRCLLVSVPRAARTLAGRLSPCESEVCELLLEGRSHAEIAGKRGTSVRTVANQLAAAFRKMGVSGRLELLTRLAGEAP